MKLACPLIASLAVSVSASAASACEPVMDERSLSKIRANSAPVATDSECRTINAGVYDDLFVGPAVDLGNGRVMQVLGHTYFTAGNDKNFSEEDKSRVLLADCNTREVTILQGAQTQVGETSCGPEYSYAPVVGKKAVISLDAGETLNELVDLAAAKGVTELSPKQHFFMFSKVWESELHPVGHKDRFDLLCGCKIFYRGSAGAKN
jgi:hypothetical protein